MQRLSHTASDREIVISLSGEIIMDMVVERKAEITGLVRDHGGDTVTLDLSGVTFMDSSGVGLLIGLRRLCQEQNKTFHVTNPPAHIHKLFEMLRLTRYFSLPPGPTDAPPA